MAGAVVPGYGVVHEGEYGTIEQFEGKSYIFKILKTIPYKELPEGTKRKWCKEHENICHADFIKVQWCSIAGGGDGHRAAKQRTVEVDGELTEVIVRKETSYLPAYTLMDVVIVFHVDEIKGLVNVKGMRDVFFVAAREADKFSTEPIPRSEHVTFPLRKKDFLGEDVFGAPFIGETIWNLKSILRTKIHTMLMSTASGLTSGFTLEPFPGYMWAVLVALFEGARAGVGSRSRTWIESNDQLQARKAWLRSQTSTLTLETATELEIGAQILGRGWHTVMNKAAVNGALGVGMTNEYGFVVPEDAHTMRVIRPPMDDGGDDSDDSAGAGGGGGGEVAGGGGGGASSGDAAEPEKKKFKRPRAPPGIRLAWDGHLGGKLSVNLSWLSLTHHDANNAAAAAVVGT
jgi:hypothetical protein